MQKKRAQLTLFILLGLIIVITFSFLIFLAGKSGQNKLQKEVDAVVADMLQTTNLNYEVQLCLKQTLEQGLVLLGAQGGNIFTYQGGPVPLMMTDYFFVRNFSNVTVSISNLSFIGTEAYPTPPLYPFPGSLFPPLPNPPPSALQPMYYWGNYWPYYGWMHLPYLCEPGGPNDVAINPSVTAPCETGFYGTFSMQDQLQRYTENMIQHCTNFSFITTTTRYTVSVGKPNITITLGIANLFVNTTYPIELQVGEGKALKYVSFQSILPVRLRRFYTYLNSLLTLDSSYINFSITRDSMALNSWDQYLTVSKYCPYCSQGTDYTDVLQITDLGSDLSGQPFIFYTAIRNRGPALDYLHPDTWQGYPQVDVVSVSGDMIVLYPKGYDPDEDQPNYTYRKWKEDHDSIFDQDCCIHNFANCKNSLFTNCMTNTSTIPAVRWSTSASYAATHQKAGLLTGEKDIGFHTSRIVAEDDAHAEDYQDVGILILPQYLGKYSCSQSCSATCTVKCFCDPTKGASSQCNGVDLDEVDAVGGHCDPIAKTYCKDCSLLDPDTDDAACSCAGKHIIPFTEGGTQEKGCCAIPSGCKKGNDCFAPGMFDPSAHYFCTGSSPPALLPCSSGNDCEHQGTAWCDGTIQQWKNAKPAHCP